MISSCGAIWVYHRLSLTFVVEADDGIELVEGPVEGMHSTPCRVVVGDPAASGIIACLGLARQDETFDQPAPLAYNAVLWLISSSSTASSWTQDARYPDVTAVAIQVGRIVAVAGDAEIQALAGPGTQTIDLAGRGRRQG